MQRTADLFRAGTLLTLAVCWGCGPDERQYGQPIEEAPSIAISELTTNVDSYLDKSIVVGGRIESICPTAGCWCVLDDDTGQLYLSLPTFSLPGGAAGRHCRVAGRLVMRSDQPTFLATGIELLQQ